MIKNVQLFHEKFGFPTGQDDVLMGNTDNQKFRIKFLVEELEELQEAFKRGDRTAAFDALLDLVYVAEGTALYMGINPTQWHAGETIVHNCNMVKNRVRNLNESKRGHEFDVIKPEGWVGPEDTLRKILSWPD